MEEDFYVPEQYVNGAFHKDTVLVDLLPKTAGKRQEVKGLSVVSRGMTQVVGTFQKANKGFGFVIPDNAKISEARQAFRPITIDKGVLFRVDKRDLGTPPDSATNLNKPLICKITTQFCRFFSNATRYSAVREKCFRRKFASVR